MTSAITTPESALKQLFWALQGAATDSEKLPHTRGRLRAAAGNTKAAASEAPRPLGDCLKFMRQLAFTYLDAPDRGARDGVRVLITAYLATLDTRVAA
ncbi:hypothetical protein sos41_11630 [Alphaproteobacteria bacterium SO-S41]|nr:hypothetical protein sos41_11630 [Alphaproteobacteria bacterium SO-S41]